MRNTQRTPNLVSVPDNAFDRLQARNSLTITNGSQFANISGMTSLEVEARETETKTTKLQARITRLNELDKAFDKVVASLANLYLVDRKVQKKLLANALSELAEFDKVPVGAAAPVRMARNELVSMKEAVVTISASTKKREFAIIACMEAHKTIKELIVKANVKLKEGDKERNPKEVNAAEMEDILKKTEGHQLPKPGKGGFAVGRAPVIPALNVSADKLTKSGFKVDYSSGYTVVHNQMIIGFDKTFMDQFKKGSKKLAQGEAAQKLCQFVSRQLKSKLILVSKHPAVAKDLHGMAWYWVMPEREWDLFAKATAGKAGDVKFGFAFNTGA